MNALLRYIFHKKMFAPYFYGVHKRILSNTDLFRSRKRIIHEGFTMDLDLSDWIPQNIYYLGYYERRELNFLRNTLKPGDVFIDVGANVGLFTLMASKLVGANGRVYAFEPFSKSYDNLQLNISLNKFSNIIAEKLAVTDQEKDMILGFDEMDQNSGMVSEFAEFGAGHENVHAITLDDYFSEFNGSLKMIKIDIEGGELNALRGMRSILLKHKPILLIELEEILLMKAGAGIKAVGEFMDETGYKSVPFENDGTGSKNAVFVPIGFQ
ncbi:MAG: FkbM family methyltransferase [Chitinophagaceae bacterium]|nr:MAG: FkbM family methyltransferase [Chitinophagaceae bacterium]